MTNEQRWAVVTGAGSGIGRAAAIELSQHGVAVVLVGRRAEMLQATADACRTETRIVDADVTQPYARVAIQQALGDRSLDYLVQIAGMMEFGALRDIPPDRWQQSFATLVHARLHLLQQLLEQMSNGARVLLAGSRSGTRPRIGAAAYCCAYAASLMLSQCLSRELGERGVHVLSFLPGSVDTPLLQASMRIPRATFPDGEIYAGERERGELVTPGEAGRFVRWLLLSAPISYYDGGAFAIDDARYRGAVSEAKE